MGRWPIERSVRACRPSRWRGLELAILASPVLISVLAVPWAAMASGQDAGGKAPGAAEKRVGRLVRITTPISDKVDNRIRRIVDSVITDAKRRGEWPVFIFEIEPGRANFGQASELARFLSSPALNGATTVAWIPKPISGHSVLIAMACDEIIMSPEAEIGKAGEFEAVIEPSFRSAYVEIANRRMSIPADVALAMLDPASELVMIETDVSREYVLASRLDELRKQKPFEKPKVIKPAGRPGVFSGTAAWELGFVKSLAENRAEVAKALGLSRDAIEEDPSLDGEWRPVRIDIKGPITGKVTDRVQNDIRRQISEQGANFFCLWIDSPGGSPTDAINLANFLAGLDPGQQRTVAYIPAQARSDAAFIALACDHIVMHPAAVLGGVGESAMNEAEIGLAAGSLREIAARKNRSPALAAAMVDPNLAVFRYVRVKDGLPEFFTPDDVARGRDADGWKQEAEVTRRGQPLGLTGEEAEDYGVARNLVRDFSEFKSLYGLENDPVLVEPNWAHVLIDALNSQGVSWLLLLIGGAALYAELQSPGIGLGGLIAAICFLLYFWIAYLGGTAGWLEVLLFLAGVICLLLEVFVLPGLGVFGLTGGLLVIASLVLASQTFVLPRNEYQMRELRNSLLLLTSAGVGVAGLAVLINRYLPHAPMFNRLMLQPPTAEEVSVISQREAVAQLDHLLGCRGTTATPLLPSGKALFGDHMVDVIADGEVIERNQPVRVVEVRGNRVLVRQVS
ncbi:MAG: hypothetical protein HYX69_16050 [Planctomycetia bacterium]|nr:hypothetical protein [Planctomycetia bacterium]